MTVNVVVGLIPILGIKIFNTFFFVTSVEVNRGVVVVVSSATGHAMSPEFDGKCETEYLNTRLPVSC